MGSKPATTLKLIKLISIFAIISQQVGTQVKSNHVDAVSCALRPDCLAAINEEIMKTISSHINNETDPCEHFWDYACGNWTAAPFYDHSDTFGAIENFYNDQLKDYIENAKEDKEIEKLQPKLRSYYEACKQASSYYLEMNGYFKAFPTMPNIQWPNFSEQFEKKRWVVSDFNWLNAIAELRRYGVNGILIDESVGFAANDSRQYVVELKMPEDDDFQSRLEFVGSFIEFGWIEIASPEHKIFAREIFEFVTQLSDLRAKHKSMSMEGEGEIALTLHELKQRVGNIDWQAYFNIVLGHMAPETLRIEIENLEYMRDLAALLEQTDDRIKCYYVVMKLCKFLSEASPNITPRNCVDHMQVTMSLGIDFLYNHRIYKTRHDDQRIIGRIFENLKLQFSKYLQRNKLNITVKEIEYLQAKLLKMEWRLGNLPEMPTAYFNNYYTDADITNNNFFRNHWELLRHSTKKQHELLKESLISLELYFVNDDIVKARNAPYFVHPRNLLIVPFNFIQMPFFHHSLHAIYQQSIMGWILAHEMNHGFELSGILLDADGNESPVGAAIKLKSEFISAIKCFRHTPTSSLNERIADINGLQLAYDAFFPHCPYLSEYLPFSGQFTTKQLYFLNFAQFSCGTLPQAIDHDRDDVRVITTLANMPEFAEVFHCSDAVAENPRRKCQMWR